MTDTTYSQNDCSLFLSQSENMMFFVESLMEKYTEGVELLQDTLFHVEFTEERAKSMVGQLLKGLPAKKIRFLEECLL